MVLGIVWASASGDYKHIPEYFRNRSASSADGRRARASGFVSHDHFRVICTRWHQALDEFVDVHGLLSGLCLFWMHAVVQKMMHGEQPS
jgi:hypothetical protein